LATTRAICPPWKATAIDGKVVGGQTSRGNSFVPIARVNHPRTTDKERYTSINAKPKGIRWKIGVNILSCGMRDGL